MSSDTQLQLASEQFSTLLNMRLQQTQSILRPLIMSGTHTGKQASPVQYINPVTLDTPAGAFAPLVLSQTGYSRRWVSGSPFEKAMGIDSFNQLMTEINPQSQLVATLAAAVARRWDDTIIEKAFADASTGTDIASLTTETFDTSLYSVADTFDDGATSLGLTIAKLREVRRVLRHNHALDNPGTPITLIIGSRQESDLIGQTQMASQEYNPTRDGVPMLKSGQLSSFLGFNFIITERLQYASNVRKCIAFVPEGLYLGVWQDAKVDIDYRTDLSGRPLQIRTSLMIGATRLEPGRVIRVLCADTTTGDNI